MHLFRSHPFRVWGPWCALALLASLAGSVPLWAQEAAAAAGTGPMDWLGELVQRRGIGVALPAVFLGGLALNLTPCVYPMIPVTLAFFSGQASEARGRAPAALAGCYVLGIAVNYALLGVLAAQTGALFGSWLQKPAVLIGTAAVIAALSLSMFGVYELRPPQALTRRLGAASAGLWGAFVMGLVVGFVAAPCIGPFILGLLLVVGTLANPAAGFLLFFVLGLGMGAPYLVLAMATSRARQLPKAGVWLVWVKKALGLMLLGLALFFVNPLLPAPLGGIAAAGLLIGAGIYLGWLDRTTTSGRWFARVRVGCGILLVAAGVLTVWPRSPAVPLVAWAPYSEAALETAQRARQPILIDIYADWCLPCVEMDHTTFRHPSVVEALQPVATMRVDATRGVSPDAQLLLERHQIYGAPTVLFFDRSGRERTELRLLGFVNAEQFLERLEQIL